MEYWDSKNRNAQGVLMRGKELVWRTLFDRAHAGHRRWPSLEELSYYAGVPKTTTHRVIQRLSEIGAVTPLLGGGFSVTSPDKVLTLMCAARDLAADTILITTVSEVDRFLAHYKNPYALGGPDAAVAHLPRRENTVAHISKRLLYLPHDVAMSLDAVPGGDVSVLTLDERASVEWVTGFSSLGQTYADLFAMPGWQASEFRYALRDTYFSGRDWEEEGTDVSLD